MCGQWLTEWKSVFTKVAKERLNKQVRTEMQDWISAKTDAEKRTLIREKLKGVFQQPVEGMETRLENIKKEAEALTLTRTLKVGSEESGISKSMLRF
ncbi:hypothetical protein GDO78_016624 [Eleutherodactylus coqui]|uniref:Uncharacterized protein n=1 Tax=Eleutherodactylus coqui TaxID=57060 RepID=A0A8J6BEL5_ELECQ|nr:hypothetical protein GDO78_016624 [Eleutherodactylus coqui]